VLKENRFNFLGTHIKWSKLHNLGPKVVKSDHMHMYVEVYNLPSIAAPRHEDEALSEVWILFECYNQQGYDRRLIAYLQR